MEWIGVLSWSLVDDGTESDRVGVRFQYILWKELVTVDSVGAAFDRAAAPCLYNLTFRRECQDINLQKAFQKARSREDDAK